MKLLSYILYPRLKQGVFITSKYLFIIKYETYKYETFRNRFSIQVFGNSAYSVLTGFSVKKIQSAPGIVNQGRRFIFPIHCHKFRHR